jgi:hypothetical protein
VWPAPEPVVLSVFAGEASTLRLPVREPRPLDDALAPFGEPEGSAPLDVAHVTSAHVSRSIHRDVGDSVVDRQQ